MAVQCYLDKRSNVLVIIYQEAWQFDEAQDFLMKVLLGSFLLLLLYYKLNNTMFSHKWKLLLLLFIGLCSATTINVLLYSEIPTTKGHKQTQLIRLASMINEIIEKNELDINVKFMSKEEFRLSYNSDRVSQLFDIYDVVQLDSCMLPFINTPLVKFTKGQLSYYDQIFQSLWEPFKQINNQKQTFNGSPSLFCSLFYIKRKSIKLQQRLYADLSIQNGQAIANMYIETKLNLGPQKTVQSIDYRTVDEEALAKIIQILKNCQQNTTIFDYYNNWCVSQSIVDFTETKYSTTYGYSQQIFALIQSGSLQQNIQILPSYSKRTIFVDGLYVRQIEKGRNQDERKRLVKFFQLMVSHQILDIFVKGLYTSNKKKTYLLPPNQQYFEKLISNDLIYRSLYNDLFSDSQTEIFPIYQSQFTIQASKLIVMLDQKLRERSIPNIKID